MLKQKRKQTNRRRDGKNNTKSHQNHNHSNGNNNNNNSSKVQKPVAIVITSIAQFPQPVVYGSLDYPAPTVFEAVAPNKPTTELPTFPHRPAAHWKGEPLLPTFIENLHGPDKRRTESDAMDPAMRIVLEKRRHAKTFKLGTLEIDIYNTKTSTKTMGNAPPKIINKFLQKDGLINPATTSSTTTTTPMKRIRDETIEVSSSVKKNRRMQELQQDTTMELSFEGKAMDKSDLVKLVDSSGVMQDDTQMPDYETSQMYIDTRNLLQSAEFNFEYRR